MPKFVALLRGINVGKAKRVAMADLRALLTELGYTDVVCCMPGLRSLGCPEHGVTAKGLAVLHVKP